jgi:hypothetical protein
MNRPSQSASCNATLYTNSTKRESRALADS